MNRRDLTGERRRRRIRRRKPVNCNSVSSRACGFKRDPSLVEVNLCHVTINICRHWQAGDVISMLAQADMGIDRTDHSHINNNDDDDENNNNNNNNNNNRIERRNS